jgi:hypothetical protein
MSLQRIKPAKQGELDGACGFYAIVNAIHALEPSFDKPELFSQVLAAFLRDGDYMSYFNGTRRGTIKNTLSRVLDYLNSHFDMYHDKTQEFYEFEFSIPYWLGDTSRNRKQVLEQMAQADNAKNCVCIVGYDHQTGGHWSVVKKVSDRGLHMLDSGNEKSIIPPDDLTIDSSRNPGPSKQYNFTSEDIFVIRKKWLGEFRAL